MSDQPSRRLVLLAAYEDFTRRETVSLRDENFELMLKLQDKKAKVIEQLSAVEEAFAPDEAKEFQTRILPLLEQEKANDKMLEEKKKANRLEYRKLAQNAVSANKLRRAYSAPVDRPVSPGSLKGRA